MPGIGDNDLEIQMGIGDGYAGGETGRPSVSARGMRLEWYREFFSPEEMDSFIDELVKAERPEAARAREVQKEFADMLKAPPTS
jgi:hypothetical protein